MNRAVLERAALSRIYITGGYTDLLFSETTSRVWPTNLGRGMGPDCGSAGTAGSARHGRNRWQVVVVGGVDRTLRISGSTTPATDRWDVARVVLPAQPEHLTVTVLDGKIHAVGGRWRDRGNLAALEIYDPTADAYHFICSTAPCCRLP